MVLCSLPLILFFGQAFENDQNCLPQRVVVEYFQGCDRSIARHSESQWILGSGRKMQSYMGCRRSCWMMQHYWWLYKILPASNIVRHFIELTEPDLMGIGLITRLFQSGVAKVNEWLPSLLHYSIIDLILEIQHGNRPCGQPSPRRPAITRSH